MAKTPAQVQRDLRERRKKAGLCTACGLPSRDGRSKCGACQRKAGASSTAYSRANRSSVNSAARSRYRGKRLRGSCPRCGSGAAPGRSLCDHCSTSAARRRRGRYRNRRGSGSCIECRAPARGLSLCAGCAEGRRRRAAMPDVAASRRGWREGRWRETLLSTAMCRARKAGLEFCITEADIPDPSGMSCPVFGTKFVIGTGSRSPESATIDRKDPSVGYVPGNVRLLSSLANSVKSNADAETVLSVARAVIEAERCGPPPVADRFPDDGSRRRRMIVQKRAANARRRMLEFSIEWSDLVLPRTCPCTGVELDYSGTGGWERRPSIDRLDNSAGYVPGNVWVISALANAVKSSANGRQILAVGEWMASA